MCSHLQPQFCIKRPSHSDAGTPSWRAVPLRRPWACSLRAAAASRFSSIRAANRPAAASASTSFLTSSAVAATTPAPVSRAHKVASKCWVHTCIK